MEKITSITIKPMETLEYEDWTIPKHVASFLKAQTEERATQVLERAERKHVDDDEARQLEPGQVFAGYNFLR